MRKSPTFLSYLSLALFAAFILGAASRGKAQVIYNFAPGATNGIPVSVTGASFDWNAAGTSSIWLGFDPTKAYAPGTGNPPFANTFNPFTAIPNGSGTLVNIMGDLTNGTNIPTTVTLSAPEVVGFLAIGDVNGNNDPYVLAANLPANQGANTLTFTSTIGRATLQNFASSSSNSWSTISANVNITSILDVNEGSNNAFLTTISGNITGGEIYKIGYGALRLTGFDTAAANTGILVEMRGAGDAGTIAFTANGSEVLSPTSSQAANLVLANTNSNGVGFTNQFTIMTANGLGSVVDGNASRGGTGSAVISLGANDQIQHTLTLSFDGVSGSNPYFKLAGFNVTVAGLVNYDSNGVIENQESEAVNVIQANGILNVALANGTFEYYNGFIRDKNANGTSQVQLNVTNVTGTGTATQVISGGNIIFTGTTTIGPNSTLELQNTTAFGNNVTSTATATDAIQNNGTLVLAPISTTTWSYNKPVTGNGNLVLLGSNNLTTGNIFLNIGANITIGGSLTATQNAAAVTDDRFTGINTFGGGFSFSAPTLLSNADVRFYSAPAGQTGSINGSTITVASVFGFEVGMSVTGPGISGAATISAVNPSTLQVTLTGNTGSGTGSGTFIAYGGTDTFATSSASTFNVSGPAAQIDVQTTVSFTNATTMLLNRGTLLLQPNATVPTLVSGGALAGSLTSITLSGTTYDTVFSIINDAAAGGQNGNRVPDATTWTSRGGQIVFGVTGSGATANQSETLGALTLAAGDLEITSSAVTTGTSALTFTDLPTRQTGSTITFSTVGLGTTTTNEVFFTKLLGIAPATEVANNNNIIGGWASVSSTVNSVAALEFATYGANGVTAYTVFNTNFTSATAATNVKLSGAATTAAAFNSLNLQGTTAYTVTLANATTVVITSGGILDSQASDTIASGTGASVLTAGGNFELIPTVASGFTLNISAKITNNGANAVSITKAGLGILNLSSTTSNFTGNVYINEGALQINTEGAAGGTGSLGLSPTSLSATTGDIFINGGELRLGAALTLSKNRNIVIGTEGGYMSMIGNGQAPGSGQLSSTYGGTITSAGTFTYLINFNSNNGSGIGIPTSFSSGVLKLTGDNNVFAGLETSTTPNATGVPTQFLGNDFSELDLTGNNNTIGRIRINGGTVHLGINGVTPSTNTISGDILVTTSAPQTPGSGVLAGLVLSGTNNLTNPAGPNIYMTGGDITLNSAGALGAATSLSSGTPVGYQATTSAGLSVTGTGGNIHLNGFNLMINVLNGSGGFTIDDGNTTTGETLFVNTVSSNTYSGQITDEAGVGGTTGLLNFTKMGTGNLTLGVNTLSPLGNNYDGVTSIQGGVLTVTTLASGTFLSSIGESSNAASNLLIGNGAALAFAGTTESFTDRSFTITSAGSDAASIIADGTSRDANIHFGDDQSVTPGASKVAYAAGIANQSLTLTLGGFNQGDNSFNEVLTNNGTGVVSLNKIGNGTWLLTENNNPTTGPLAGTGYTGLTTVSGGALAITADGALGSAAGGTILEGGASTQSFTVGGVLDFRNVIYTTPEPIFMEGGEIISTTGISSFTGPINVSLASTVQIFDNTSLTLSGSMSGVGSINQLGQGTLVLSGNNSARTSNLAAWTVQAGELELDYSGDLAAIAANHTTFNNGSGQPFHKLTAITATTGAALTLGGSRLGGVLFVNDGTSGALSRGTVLTLGASGTIFNGGTFAEYFSGLTLNAGENQIINSQPTAWFSGATGSGHTVNDDTVPSVIMVLGNITVAAGATLNLNEPGIATTTKTNVGNARILGAWATIGQNDWASQSTFSYLGAGLSTAQPYIMGLMDQTGGGGYTPNVWGAGNLNSSGGSVNVDVTLSSTQATTSNVEAATLRYNTPSASPIVVTLSQPLNYISTGGIMVTAAVGSTDTFLTGGNLQAGTGTGTSSIFANQDFIIYQYDTAAKFVIGSTIQNNSNGGTDGLNKLGNGTLVLTGANTYTGVNTLSNGYISVNTLGPAGFAASTGVVSTDVSGFTTVYGATAGLTIGQTVVAAAGYAAPTTLQIVQILDPFHYVLGLQGTGVVASPTSSNTASTFTFGVSGVIGGAYSSTTVAGSNEITVAGTIGTVGIPLPTGTDGIVIGQAISGVGIPEGSYVTGILDSTHILISSAATASGTNTLSYATNASGIGAGPNGIGQIFLNGGTLQYTGQTAITDRAFTVNFNGAISVTDPNTVLTMNGVLATGGNIGDYTIAKAGEGTLRFTDATNSGYGVTGFLANQGRLQLVYAFANDRYARNDVATLTVGGGAFEVIGDPIASRSQALPGQFSIGVGQSQVEVTSQIGVTTALSLQSASSPLVISRAVGGTVQFVENPGTLGVANLVINTISFNTQVPIPYAVYKDTTLNTDIGINSLPGFNDFAAIDGQTGNVVAASTINGAFFVASSESALVTDPNQWNNFLLGVSPAVSEGAFSFNSGAGTTFPNTVIHASVIRYFANSTSIIDLGGTGLNPNTMTSGTSILAVDQGGILLAEAIGHNNKIIQNGNLTSGAGDLIIQNYNYSAPFQIKANIVNNNLGSEEIGFNLTTQVEIINSANVSLANFHVGQVVSVTDLSNNVVVPAGTTIVGFNVQTNSVILSNPINVPGGSAGDEDAVNLVYNQATGLTQAGQSVTKTVGQNALSTVNDIASTASGSAIVSLTGGSTTAGLVVGMTAFGVGIPAGTTIVSIDSLNNKVTLSANATAANPTLGVEFIQLATTSSTLAGVGTTILSGTNTYTGNTYITGGVLRLESLQAIPGGIGATTIASTTSSAIIIDGGQIGLDGSVGGTNTAIATNGGSFLRGLGTAANQVQFLGSGGFAAYGTDAIVNLGGQAAPTPLTWGSTTGFLNDDSILILGAPDADHTINFENPIALGPLTRVVRTDNGTAQVDAILSGALTSDGGGLIKTGYGTLELAAPNTYTGGTTVGAGNLYALNPASAFGSGAIGLGNTTDSDIDDNVRLTLGNGTASNTVNVGSVNSTGVTVISGGLTGTTGVAAGLSGAVNLERDTYLNASPGNKLTLSGVVSGLGGITVIGGGDVYLGNATLPNTYGTSGGTTGAAINGGTVIRSGTIHVVNNAAALGLTTVELGDTIKVLAPVIATTNSTSITMQGGTFDPTASQVSTGISGAFFNVSNVVNGVTLTPANADNSPGDGTGARILIRDENGNPERNGIYEVVKVIPASVNPLDGSTTAGTMELVRVTDFGNPVDNSTSVPVTTFNMNYGSQVTDSTTGITYFMASNSVTNVNQADADPTAWLVDNANPNVALLADTVTVGNLPIANNVDVNNTNGTGTTTIGGSSVLTTGSVTFSGALTLEDLTGTLVSTPKTLFLSSFTSTGNGVIFTGLISEANSADDTLAIQTTGPSTGAGIVSLNQTNTYHGTTTVSANTILRPLVGTTAGNSALGFGDGTAATGTIVATGGELQLTGNLTFTTEALTINGVGNTSGGGALHNTVGTNTWAGPITVASNATIATDILTTLNLTSPTPISEGGIGGFGLTFNTAGTANVSSGITGNDPITATGAGTTNLTGVVATTAANAVTMNGTGALVLTNANTYTGATVVNSGILQIQNSPQALGLGGDGTQATGTTVNTGGELQINGTLTVGTASDIEGIFLNGSGFAGAGALNVLSGTGTINGPVTLQTASTVSTNSGASLVIGTNTTGNHPNITASGAGATLTTIGAGTTTIVDAINTGTGGLVVSSGTTVLNNPVANPSTYSGATNVTGGNLQVGVASVGSTGTGGGTPGAVNVGGTSLAPATLSGTGQVIGATTISSGSTVSVVAPGDTGGTGIGTLTFTHGLTFGSGTSTVNLQAMDSTNNGLQASVSADKIVVTGTLALSSTTAVNVLDAGNFASFAFNGEVLNLLSWTTLTTNGFTVPNQFTTGGTDGNLTLPTLTNPNLEYNTSAFLTAGQISIQTIVAPEPSRVLLITSGLAMMMMRRRRRKV